MTFEEKVPQSEDEKMIARLEEAVAAIAFLKGEIISPGEEEVWARSVRFQVRRQASDDQNGDAA